MSILLSKRWGLFLHSHNYWKPFRNLLVPYLHLIVTLDILKNDKIHVFMGIFLGVSVALEIWIWGPKNSTISLFFDVFATGNGLKIDFSRFELFTFFSRLGFLELHQNHIRWDFLKSRSASLIKIGTWTFTNCCFWRHLPNFNEI